MTGEAAPGAVIACWADRGVAFGVVAASQKGRLVVVGEEGKEERVGPARVAEIVDATGSVPGATLEERRAAAGRARGVAEDVRARAAGVDVALLWQIVSETADRDAIAIDELADLALGTRDGRARAAVVVALVEEGIRFARRGDGWIVRDAEAVEQRETQRRREAEREAERQQLFASLARLGSAPAGGLADSEVTRRYVAALEHVAVEPRPREALRKLALEALAKSGISYERPHEGAFTLLRRLGRFTSDDENLQVVRFGLRTEFPGEVVSHAASLPASFDSAGRRDRTDRLLVSIDGSHTVEIDDLVGAEPLASGGFRVEIHIADPAAFVAPDDPVDREALSRGLSHYMPDRRIPMLPPEISESRASLVEGAERPALSFVVEIDATGEIVDQRIEASVVRSSARLDYAEADRAISGGAGAVAELLRHLDEVGRLREEARRRAGALVLRLPEADIHVAADGTPAIERLPAESPSRRAVTETMILAGLAAARLCSAHSLPVLYRRQPAPDAPPDPGLDLSDPVVARRVVRTLRRGEVSLEPAPHWSLGLPAYAQVTSPIRRYQDLASHRQIAAFLSGRPLPYDVEALRRIAASTEQADADARMAERGADEYWTLRYLELRQGAEVEAVVVETDPRTVVLLEETLMEQPVAELRGVAPGDRVRLRIERVRPRAGLLHLRPAG